MNLLVRDDRGAFGRQPWGVASTLGTGGFPTMTLVFHRCNARHRIKVWDGAPEGWTPAAPAYSDVVAHPDEAGMPSPGSPQAASFGRRFVAWLVDWVLCTLVVFGLLGFDYQLGPDAQPDLFLGAPTSSWAVLGVFAAENLLLVTLLGSTVGHRLLGLQVWQVRVGAFPLQVLVRTALLCLFVPALVTRSGRGLHDVVAGTRIVRP